MENAKSVVEINAPNSNTSDIIMAIAAILNIVLILIFYCRDKSSRKHDEIVQRKSYWFRNIIFDKNVSNIEDFYQRCKSLIDDLRALHTIEIANMQSVTGAFQDQKRQLIYCFNDRIRIFDPFLANALDNSLDKLEDLFTNSLAKFLVCNDDNKFVELENDIIASKTEFLKTIFDYEMKGYKM